MIQSVIGLSLLLGLFFWLRWYKSRKHIWRTPQEAFPVSWPLILSEKVNYYSSLNGIEKKRFEYLIQEFLLNCRITGIKTTVTDEDKILVAASAVIPIFGFENWKYHNIKEVLLYPSSFNEQFETDGKNKPILGMVGNGYMENVMILSQKALHHGFQNESDKRNTAIHEFVHLIDKADGNIDGIPEILLEKQYTIPWLNLIKQKIDEIQNNNSDINPYGATNNAEFFSVISEYFFEQPQLLERKHPQLYGLLEGMFRQDMSDKKLQKQNYDINRNAPCLCNSGLKFKKCCGKENY